MTEEFEKLIENKELRPILVNRLKTHAKPLVERIGNDCFGFLGINLQRKLMASIVIRGIFLSYFDDVKSDVIKPLDLVICGDYSFIVLPAAKALEGFIVNLLIKLKLTKKSEIKKDPYVRIGRIINSEQFERKVVDKRYRYVPKELQVEWDKSRNAILHYDVIDPVDLTLKQASEKIDRIIEVIGQTYTAFVEKKH